LHSSAAAAGLINISLRGLCGRSLHEYFVFVTCSVTRAWGRISHAFPMRAPTCCIGWWLVFSFSVFVGTHVAWCRGAWPHLLWQFQDDATYIMANFRVRFAGELVSDCPDVTIQFTLFCFLLWWVLWTMLAIPAFVVLHQSSVAYLCLCVIFALRGSHVTLRGWGWQFSKIVLMSWVCSLTGSSGGMFLFVSFAVPYLPPGDGTELLGWVPTDNDLHLNKSQDCVVNWSFKILPSGHGCVVFVSDLLCYCGRILFWLFSAFDVMRRAHAHVSDGNCIFCRFVLRPFNNLKRWRSSWSDWWQDLLNERHEIDHDLFIQI